MVYIIGIILLLIILFIVGFFVKKRYYTDIDKLESWKIEVMNRPVMDEVGKIKQLKMEGEAEEYFERWRTTWDNVVTVELPEVEKLLYDAESNVDKFRFSKVKETFEEIETALKNAESKTDALVKQVQDIIDSEEKNIETITEIEEKYKSLKKELLAHRHTFGKASDPLEESLINVKSVIEKFEIETENGNYLTAREIVRELKENVDSLQNIMENIPVLLNECLHTMPNQLKEIKSGMKEMAEEGYHLDHLGIEKEITTVEEQIVEYVKSIEQAEIKSAVDGLPELKENLESIYNLLEDEVEAKQFVLSKRKDVEESLDNADQIKDDLIEEVELVKVSYHLTESEEQMMSEMNRKIEMMRKSASLILSEETIQSSAYTIIREKVEGILKDLSLVEEEQQLMKEVLQTLRKDEIEAREKIQTLKKLIQDAVKLVSHSNVPGIPENIESNFQEARDALIQCFSNLDQKPLNMLAVRESLETAESKATGLYDQVVEMIENVYFIEKIIQYGNRYRRKNQSIHMKLSMAEEAFRSFDYEKALEEAASAVEEAEPGAIKRIETIINEEIKKNDKDKIPVH